MTQQSALQPLFNKAHPWKKELIWEDGKYKKWRIVESGKGGEICEVFYTNEKGEQHADLITAAPTMYDYIKSQADSGEEEAIKIMEAIHAR